MSAEQNDPEQLRAEIDQTRAELGATVQALAAKTDVKGRAKQTAADLTEQGREQLVAAAGRVAEVAGTVKDQVVTATSPLQQHARTLPSRAAAAARRPQGRSAAMPAAAAVLAAAGIVLIVRGRRA